TSSGSRSRRAPSGSRQQWERRRPPSPSASAPRSTGCDAAGSHAPERTAPHATREGGVMKRSRSMRTTLGTPLAAVGLVAVGGPAAAVTPSSTIRAKATTKTTIVRYDPGGGQSTSSTAFQDIIAGTQPTITFTKPSILLVTLTAETSCYSSVKGNAS